MKRYDDKLQAAPRTWAQVGIVIARTQRQFGLTRLQGQGTFMSALRQAFGDERERGRGADERRLLGRAQRMAGFAYAREWDRIERGDAEAAA